MSTVTSRPLDPTGADHWRRWRRPLAIVALLLVTAVLLGIVQSRASRGFLDTEGIDQAGARALARLLADQGVDIVPVRTAADATAAAGPSDTVLVTIPDLLTTEQVDRLVDTGARLVLVAAQVRTADYAPGLAAVAAGDPETLEPGCDLPVAVRAEAARLGGTAYAGDVSRTTGARCYPVDGEPSLAVSETASGNEVVLLGTADPFTNEYLDEDGNAALALGVLGATPRLVWYRPVPEEAGDAPAPFTEQLPGWVRAAAWQLVVAVALAALWRARRLGRLVAEPLPVVVRASETTEGRARLYRRGRSRAHAAALLRAAAIRRLAAGAHLPAPLSPPPTPGAGPADTEPPDTADAEPPDAEPPDTADAGPSVVGAPAGVQTLAATLAERTGRPAARIVALLAGPPPADDAALVRLADELDDLENAGVPRATGATPSRKDPRPS